MIWMSRSTAAVVSGAGFAPGAGAAAFDGPVCDVGAPDEDEYTLDGAPYHGPGPDDSAGDVVGSTQLYEAGGQIRFIPMPTPDPKGTTSPP